MPNEDPTPPASPAASMASPSLSLTDAQLQMLINNMQQPYLDLQQRLIEQLTTMQILQGPTGNTGPAGNFTKCSLRFNGLTDVDAFIDALETYKECSGITDEHALRGLSMLLTDNAATYWQGVKSTINTWNEALSSLRSAYIVKLPPHRVFQTLFATEQSEGESTELFVCKVRALIAQLPYVLEERIQIDMIYGLLCKKVKKRLVRDNVVTFKELIESARSIELSFSETESKLSVRDVKANTPKEKVPRTRCVYCKTFGHTVETCETLKRKNERKPAPPKSAFSSNTRTDSSSEIPRLSCYGCGTVGVTRTRCTKCNPPTNPPRRNDTENAQSVVFDEFYSIDEQDTAKPRPVLPITICGLKGTAYADTGATRSIMGHNLYERVKHICSFEKHTMNMTLADGSQCLRDVLTTLVNVQVHNKMIPVTFIVLATDLDNRTLLGTDFLTTAEIVIDLGKQEWFFRDLPDQVHRFLEDIRRLPSDMSFNGIELRQNEASDLDPDQRKQLSDLLQTNYDTFALGGAPTPYAEHCIVVPDGQRPIAAPPYRLPGLKKQLLEKKIDKLLSTDVIEECESPWAAPVVLVPKPNGDVRLCVDYRRLNEVTVKDKYPMPRMEDLLHTAKNTKYMTTLDLRSGYHQVPVRECDREKTAFISPTGMYRFKRMPFGLANAPATFQRLINQFKAGLGDVTILAYLDDIIILSDSFEKHLSDLQKTFDRLRIFCLRINREKSVFACSSVRYLGHIITSKGIATCPDKVAAIAKMSEPRTVKQLMSFIQTCAWYRRFIENFSGVAKPLTDLLRKNVEWTWGPQQQAAYNDLKRLLTTAPVLRQADETQPYIINTDASDYAIGGVLLQGQGRDERPVEYCSRLLTHRQKDDTRLPNVKLLP